MLGECRHLPLCPVMCRYFPSLSGDLVAKSRKSASAKLRLPGVLARYTASDPAQTREFRRRAGDDRSSAIPISPESPRSPITPGRPMTTYLNVPRSEGPSHDLRRPIWSIPGRRPEARGSRAREVRSDILCSGGPKSEV